MKLLIIAACFISVSWNVQAGDHAPKILNAVSDSIVDLTQTEKTAIRGENIRAPARVHAQTYCNDRNDGDFGCLGVSSKRRYAGNGKYWYSALFRSRSRGFYRSQY